MKNNKKFKGFLESMFNSTPVTRGVVSEAYTAKLEAEEEKKLNWNEYLSNKIIKNGLMIMKIITQYNNPTTGNAYEAYAVGGLPRDLLMGKKDPHDFDIASNMPMELAFKVFGREGFKITKGAGKATEEKRKEKGDFQTAKIYYEGDQYDYANYRTEIGYSDHRRPDIIKVVETFEEDSARRDLTINALGADVHGNIVDFWGGVKDLEQGIIRTVGEPEDRFEEDYLRMIRAIRFASRNKFKIDEKTWKSIEMLRDKLVHSDYPVAPSRIKDEFKSVIGYGGKTFAYFLTLLQKAQIFELILPGVDLSERKLKAIINADSKDVMINYAILFSNTPKETIDSIINQRRHEIETKERSTIEFVNKYLKVYPILHKADSQKAMEIIMDKQGRFPVLRDVFIAFHGSDVPDVIGIVKNADKYLSAGDKAKEVSNLMSHPKDPEDKIKEGATFGIIKKAVTAWIFSEFKKGNDPSKDEISAKIKEVKEKV